MVVLSCLVLIMSGIILALAVRIHFMHKSMQEICVFLQQYADNETNILIDVPSRDRYVCMLVSSINKGLRILRKQRNQYLNGNRELKDAITNISHDLRTPLTAISGYLELLKAENESENVCLLCL